MIRARQNDFFLFLSGSICKMQFNIPHHISDISHQLKTPLAALNIYKGLLQDEDIEVSSVKEFAGLSEIVFFKNSFSRNSLSAWAFNTAAKELME